MRLRLRFPSAADREIESERVCEWVIIGEGAIIGERAIG